MPPNQDDVGGELSTPDVDLLIMVQNDDVISTSSASDFAQDESPLYEVFEPPEELTLKERVQNSCGCEDLSEVTKVSLAVIASEVSLQHLHLHVPKLTELILDGSHLNSLRDLGCHLSNLKILKVNKCGLENLDGSYGFDGLEEIYVSRNKLKDISQCANFTNLRTVDASHNILSKIDDLYFLSLCEELKKLTLEGNENVTSVNDYRKAIKKLIPKLEILDGEKFTPEECKILENKSLGKGFLPAVGISTFSINFPPKPVSSVTTDRATSSNLPPVKPHGTNRILPNIKTNKK